jgi:hypothetical protein
MRIPPTLLAAVFSLACLAAPARTEEPKAFTLSPEIQALLAELLKAVNATKSEATALLEPETEAPAAQVANREVKQPALGSLGSLRTGSLTTSGLAPTGGLGGHGTKSGSSRASEEEWRMLFPLRQDRR